ncbi:SAM domain-containing protein [Tieghemostelium lacteum]|uniref:SAM domain-containing protein n=1 Tax=Tieghemostelium lacteum TaxID=361077 RepID=A0A152A1I1_TIELA|nr:SAM domain-containing protein [Tieghemostelium lacteum]|eukprot:KYQ99944.1 SAM domain-containing protein [Tieghemostelium lacteum]
MNISLRLIVHEAKDLKAADLNGSSDPYCKVKVDGGTTIKSEVVKATLAPVWNFPVDCGSVHDGSLIHFEVFDWDRIGSHKSLGSIEINVATLKAFAMQGQSDQWLRLDKVGFIRVSFEFTPPIAFTPDKAQIVPGIGVVVTPNMPIGTLPPPIYYPKAYLPTFPTKTCAELVLPGETYQTKYFVTGEPANGTLILHVSEPFIIVRNSYVTLKGKVMFRGKKNKELITDYRNLLHGLPEGKVRLERGKHIFPFQFFIPKSCNSSININNYQVKYGFQFSADIVNRPDIEIFKAINVVNIEDTIYKITQSAIDNKASKSPITGGNIEMIVRAPKNSYYPGEDIELEVTIANNSKKRIKKMDFHILRTDTEGTDLTTQPVINCLSSHKQFYPKINANSKFTQTMVVETNSSLVQSISQAKIMQIKYSLKCIVDIPNCVDLSLQFPINIVLPDPKKEYLPSPLTEVSQIPRYIYDWSSRHFNSWLLFRVKCTEVLADPVFYQYALSGEELISLDRATLSLVLQAAGPRTQEIINLLEKEIYEILMVRNLLKDLQLPHLIDIFEDNFITASVISKLEVNDLIRMNIPIGDIKRISEAIHKLQ